MKEAPCRLPPPPAQEAGISSFQESYYVKNDNQCHQFFPISMLKGPGRGVLS